MSENSKFKISVVSKAAPRCTQIFETPGQTLSIRLPRAVHIQETQDNHVGLKIESGLAYNSRACEIEYFCFRVKDARALAQCLLSVCEDQKPC